MSPRGSAAASAPVAIDEALAVAVEHVAWCLLQGQEPIDVFCALDLPPPHMPPRWNDAIWALAAAHDALRWGLAGRRLAA